MSSSEIIDVGECDKTSSLSLEYVYQVAILLTRLPLPKDVIPWILEFGGFSVSHLAVRNTQERRVFQSQAGLVHSRASIPRTIHPKSIRAVHFETVSHDQGWSDYAVDHGSYRGSWTWFEAGIIDDHNHDDQQQHEEENHDNNEHVEDFRLIVTNVHASKSPRRHYVKWSRNDRDVWTQDVLNRLETGESVAITVHARYPGWMNHVKSTSISFEYLPVRKVP